MPLGKACGLAEGGAGGWRRGASPISSPRGRVARRPRAGGSHPELVLGLVPASGGRRCPPEPSFPGFLPAVLLQSWAPFLWGVLGWPQPQLVSPLCCHFAWVCPERALWPRGGDADPARREALARAPPAAPVLFRVLCCSYHLLGRLVVGSPVVGCWVCVGTGAARAWGAPAAPSENRCWRWKQPVGS